MKSPEDSVTEIRATKRTSTDGRHLIEFGVRIASDGPWYCVWIDGREASTATYYKAPDRRTWRNGIIGHIGEWAVLEKEAPAIDAALAQLQRIFNESPAGLRFKRECLVKNLDAMLAVGGGVHSDYMESDIAMNRRAIEELDAEHPEILAEIERGK